MLQSLDSLQYDARSYERGFRKLYAESILPIGNGLKIQPVETYSNGDRSVRADCGNAIVVRRKFNGLRIWGKPGLSGASG